MGNKLATFWFADVRLQTGGQTRHAAGRQLPGGAHRAEPPLLRRPATPAPARRAGTGCAFLRDLEYAYYDDNGRAPAHELRLRRADLRHDHGQQPRHGAEPAGRDRRPRLLAASAVSRPAVGFGELDSAEHLHGQHAGDDNTLAGLARQRIKGKPFTVTEYQHPSPNYYGAEGPLLLAAYGALAGLGRPLAVRLRPGQRHGDHGLRARLFRDRASTRQKWPTCCWPRTCSAAATCSSPTNNSPWR